MNLQELETLILEQSQQLIKYKDSQVKPVLLAYKSLLDDLLVEITKMYSDTNLQGEWDWKAISKSKRIESLFLQLESSLQEIAATTEKTLETAMNNIVTVDYALASYMLVKQLDNWIPIPPLISSQALKEIVDIPWSGDHFSSRIWLNKELLKTNLRRELTRAIVTGESFQKTTKKLTDVMQTEAYKAETLVRTEMIAASNRGQKEHYKQFNKKFNKYNMLSGVKVLETLDRRTCSRCRDMDGKEFGPDEIDSISDVEHPRCRRRIVPIVRGFDDDKFTRAARDEKGKYYRTKAKDFEEYAKEQAIPFKYEQSEKARQQANAKAQYKKYKERIPDLPDYKVFASQKARNTDLYSEWEQLYKDIGLQIKFRDEIRSGSYNLKINQNKQNRHIKGTNEYKQYVLKLEKRGLLPSEMDVDPQEVVNKYHGTGRIIVNSSNQPPKESITAESIIGRYFDETTKSFIETKAAMILYSKTGTHVYPKREERN